MIKVFKEHSSKTCILDDFGFYEARQKTIQEKKAKQLHFPKQARFLALAFSYLSEAHSYALFSIGKFHSLISCNCPQTSCV